MGILKNPTRLWYAIVGVGIGSGDHMERMLKQAQGPSFEDTLTAPRQSDKVALLDPKRQRGSPSSFPPPVSHQTLTAPVVYKTKSHYVHSPVENLRLVFTFQTCYTLWEDIHSKTDKFSEKFQTSFDPCTFLENILDLLTFNSIFSHAWY